MSQNRASTITNSQLKEGYKQTEVGIIPEDWDVLPCSNLSNLITVGIVIRPTQYYVKNGVSALRSANIREAGISDSEMVFISEKVNVQLAKSQVREGDVLTVRTGYPGTSAVVTSKWAGSNCIDILITRPSKLINSEYLTAWINSPFGKYQVLKNQGGLAQQHFNVGDLRKLLVAVPSLPEQEAIACTLSDIYALIESLDRLLTKKRQIKQGAMQELLRSKEGWVEKSLGEVADFFKGKGLPKSEIIPFATYPCIHYGELFTKYPETILNVQSQTNINTGVFYSVANDVLMPTSDVTPNGLATASCILEDGVILGGDVLVIRIDPRELNGSFLSYLIRYSKKQIMQLVSGTTVYHLYGSDMHNFSFSMPTIEEQIEIANILSDMDAEIGSIESKLTKTRQLKQGMMHELLTGRIRLV